MLLNSCLDFPAHLMLTDLLQSLHVRVSELDFSDFLHELHLQGPGFSWMSPGSIMHKRTVNFVAVLFDLGLYGGGVISRPVELLDLRHLSCAIVFQIGLYR